MFTIARTKPHIINASQHKPLFSRRFFALSLSCSSLHAHIGSAGWKVEGPSFMCIVQYIMCIHIPPCTTDTHTFVDWFNHSKLSSSMRAHAKRHCARIPMEHGIAGRARKKASAPKCLHATAQQPFSVATTASSATVVDRNPDGMEMVLYNRNNAHPERNEKDTQPKEVKTYK